MKIGLIGTGHMGEPILIGIAKNMKSCSQIIICNRNAEHSKLSADKAKAEADREIELAVANDNSSLCEESDVVIIGVRPQGMDDLMHEIKKSLNTDKLIISLAAGIKHEYFEEYLGEIPVILAMPNQPARYHMGITSICKNEYVSDESMLIARDIFETVGEVVEIDESNVDCFTGISSSTAYIHAYIGALIDGAVSNGMPEDVARKAISQAVKGGAEMVLRSGDSVDELLEKAATKGGTTIEGIKVLREKNLDVTMKSAIQASIDRAVELGEK